MQGTLQKWFAEHLAEDLIAYPSCIPKYQWQSWVLAACVALFWLSHACHGMRTRGVYHNDSGAPIDGAHKQLVTALTDLRNWTDRSNVTKEMMLEMLKVRSNIQDLAAKHKLK